LTIRPTNWTLSIIDFGMTGHMSQVSGSSSCGLCGRHITPGSGYIVRIEAMADPQMPPMSMQQIESLDFDATLSELVRQMEGMTADELQDGVYRKFTYHLCGECHREFLANPLGKPRRNPVGKN